jgi:hypothetical protein
MIVYIFSPLGDRLYGFKQKGSIELYHIDRCTDPNCHLKDTSILPDIFSFLQKKYAIYSSSTDSVVNFSPNRTAFSNLHITMKSGSIEDANESEMIDFRGNGSLPMVGDRSACKPMASISFRKIKLVNKISATGNRNIKPPNHISNEGTNDLSVVKLMKNGKVKLSRMKSKMEPNNDRTESHEEASPRFDIADGVRFVQVGNVVAKPSIQHSNNRKPTCLDANENTAASFRSSGNVKNNKVTVTHVMSTHRQKESTDEPCASKVDTTDVLPIQTPLNISINPVSAKMRDESTRSVRIDRIPTGKKNININNDPILSSCIDKIAKKKRKHKRLGKNSVQSGVIVQRMQRKNIAK